MSRFLWFTVYRVSICRDLHFNATATWLRVQYIMSIHLIAKSNVCIAEQHYCRTRPCKNGATCREDAAHHTYKCHCKGGFTGKQCQYSEWSQCLLAVADSTCIIMYERIFLLQQTLCKGDSP